MTSTRNARGPAGPPETVTEFVTEEIRDRIVLGQIEAGAKLSVYQLADEIGVSRVPLREAVRQLEAESLVVNIARRGTQVRPLNGSDVRDAFAMIRLLEVIAAERAATSSNGVAAREMRHWYDEMSRLLAEGVPQKSVEMLHAHRAFHFAMYQGSGDLGVLYRHLCMLWNTAERYVLLGRTPARQKKAHGEHARLLKLIEHRDSAGVGDALREHIDAAFSATVSALGERGITVEPL